ncbi:pyridoxamine 5'-phosphate oxidase family protein [Paraflavitalea sp. CAU 1676]|uniref:pyridoxamine 5'-phosphate oxidase family protein n=1 Tax=Paraflavitalea sp. CAU 1676 TaxID=3032598 RepID=UPI0023D9E00B|nr:pyridoxamine 5'-phosphate oxidase family protein [Paraflavitalea sp. CAU 1676]MDF2188558.1 pyridoxamine 5'-phosphate oxidase family protein [Paraflavitalea sp. CAU 1676]
MMTTKIFNQPESMESANQIKEQIMTLGSALFFTENESLLKLPVHVINNVQIDEQNRIWFLIQRPTQALTEFDQELPAKLDFFKKGISFYIKIKGTAMIVDNAAKLNELSAEGEDTTGMVAICVKIKQVEITETGNKGTQVKSKQSRFQISSLFF